MLLLLLSKFYQKFVADIIKNGLEEKIVADEKWSKLSRWI